MKSPLIRRSQPHREPHPPERGVTILLVAAAMVAIIGMAALSIDVITLYLAREEAQRAADTAALAAARIISMSGITAIGGDPDDFVPQWRAICGVDNGTTQGLAGRVAKAVARQNSVGGSAASITVQYSSRGAASGSRTDCSTLPVAFTINPGVTVKVTSVNLPTLFSRIWSRSPHTVSASATAEAFNPSNSDSLSGSGKVVPVIPRCVKPWIVPNEEPGNPGHTFVKLSDGTIQNPGISTDGSGDNGVIGETFTIVADCKTGNPDCKHGSGNGLQDNPPRSTATTLDYVPALVQGAPIAFPTCANGSAYQEAIGGCDQSTVYACGTVNGSQADLTFNPGKSNGPTASATQCLIHQTVGQDVLDSSQFPFQINAGPGNPIVTSGVITSSSSIVTVPIYDDTPGPFTVDQPQVTIVGFLQVFINSIDGNGNVNVTVLNVAGCGNNASTTLSAPGTSPVPIRLITSQ
jgi:hypothetical protein